MPLSEQIQAMPTRQEELLSLVNHYYHRVYMAIRERCPHIGETNEVMELVNQLCESVKLQTIDKLTSRKTLV